MMRTSGFPVRTAARSLAPLLSTMSLMACASTAPIPGEMHRITTQPSAAVRDAAHRTDLRITVWYPAATGAVAQPLIIGPPREPLFRVGSTAPDAPFASDRRGARRPVILLSHGFGGTARVMGWFGTAMAEEGYVVIAVDHPGNNGMDEMTIPGAILPWERAEDLKRALEAVGQDSVLGPHLDLQRVGAAGFSAGGFTALLLGGARADPERFLSFCHANPNDGLCRPQIEFAVTEADRDRALDDPRVAALEATAKKDHSLPAVKAVFAMAPAIVQGIDPRSLQSMRLPVRVLAGAGDDVASPATNAEVLAREVPGVRLTVLPGAGHYVFLATCTEAGVARLPVCAGAGPQAEAHQVAIKEAKELFARYLRP